MDRPHRHIGSLHAPARRCGRLARSLLVPALLASWAGPAFAGARSPAAAACLQDLESIPAFLLANDTGAPDHLAQRGQAALEIALAEARRKAGEVTSDAACDELLRVYLKAWRPGHLGVSPFARPAGPSPAAKEAATRDAPAAASSRAPALRVLSPGTILLDVPTFGWDQAAPLRDLLSGRRGDLESHPLWILDLRRNDGGADSTYEPLLEWILVNDVFEVDAEFLATPAIIQADEHLCQEVAPGDAACTGFMTPLLAALRKASPGTYVRRDPTAPAIERSPAPEDARRRPSHVAVLVDRACGSSCEQFLLAVRQSANVKLYGRRTFGCLDYSNVRPHLLPSGRRRLHFATSRSLRLPHQPVDAAGIAPDVYLPPPANAEARDQEVATVQALLERLR